MKNLLSICFIFINCMVLYGQDSLSGIHGLKNEKGEMNFEVAGYTISVNDVKGSVDNEETIRLVEKTYGLDDILMVYTDSALKVKNKIIEGLVNMPDLPFQISQKCYLFQENDETITVLYMETTIKRDFVLEEEIVRACINGRLSKYASTIKTASYITLAGQDIYLNEKADWVAPHKVIYNESQISWSEFSSLSRANQYLENQILIDKADLVFVEDMNMKVLFNQKWVTARRIIYDDRSDSESSDYLYVYYIVTELRGRYIACILSHYDYSRNETDVPAFLNSVMRIRPVSESVSTYDLPDNIDQEEREAINREYNSFMFEFQLSSWMPVGNLRDVYKAAPTIGVYVCYPIRKMGLDLGFQIGLPINSSFDYYKRNSSISTEATYFAGLNLRGKYRGVLGRNVVYFSYVGMGVNWISTDVESGYNEIYDEYYYHTVTAMDIFGGFNILYKKIGGFIEYHYTPYGNSSRVRSDIGNSSINLGISFTVPY